MVSVLKSFSRVFILSFCFVLLSQCGGGSSTTALTEEEQAQEDLETALLPVTEEIFNIIAEANGLDGSASAPAAISAMGRVEDETNINCAFTESGGAGIDISQNGLAGTFGVDFSEGNLVSITPADYCGQGGEYTAFSMNGSSKLSFSCSGIVQTDIVSGNGVFKTTSDQTFFSKI